MTVPDWVVRRKLHLVVWAHSLALMDVHHSALQLLPPKARHIQLRPLRKLQEPNSSPPPLLAAGARTFEKGHLLFQAVQNLGQ